jgi:hypothetical protein
MTLIIGILTLAPKFKMYGTVEVEEEAIERVLEKAQHGIENGTAFAGMSYEQGIQDAIDWITGNDDAEPLEDVELDD